MPTRRRPLGFLVTPKAHLCLKALAIYARRGNAGQSERKPKGTLFLPLWGNDARFAHIILRPTPKGVATPKGVGRQYITAKRPRGAQSLSPLRGPLCGNRMCVVSATQSVTPKALWLSDKEAAEGGPKGRPTTCPLAPLGRFAVIYCRRAQERRGLRRKKAISYPKGAQRGGIYCGPAPLTAPSFLFPQSARRGSLGLHL